MKDIPEKIDSLKAEQHGGQHYKGMAIEPAYYNEVNGFTWIQGEIIKLVSRHQLKNGAEDLRKAIHYSKMLLEIHYQETYTAFEGKLEVESMPAQVSAKQAKKKAKVDYKPRVGRELCIACGGPFTEINPGHANKGDTDRMVHKGLCEGEELHRSIE